MNFSEGADPEGTSVKPTDAPPLIKLPLQQPADLAPMPAQVLASATSRGASGGPAGTLSNVRVLKT